MTRLRTWWAPKEPVERAGLVAVLLIGAGLLGLTVVVLLEMVFLGVR